MKCLWYVAVLLLLVSCRMAHRIAPSLMDSVPQSAYAPLENDTIVPINLKMITGVDFPRYKIVKETPSVPDSVSIAAVEETVASGNFSAVLVMDTVAPVAFFQRIDTLSRHDSCWQVTDKSYLYQRKMNGVSYTVVLSPQSKVIHYSQLRQQN